MCRIFISDVGCECLKIVYLRRVMADSRRRFLKYIIPAVVYMAAIFTVSSIPGVRPPRLGVSWDDKVYHFIEYAGLGYFLFRAFLYWGRTRLPRTRLILSIFLGAIIGAADEMYQVRIPNRAGQFDDWIVDAIAVSISAVIFYAVAVSRERKAASSET